MTSRRVAYVLRLSTGGSPGHHEQDSEGVGCDRHLRRLLRQLHAGEVHRAYGEVPPAQQRCDDVLSVPRRSLHAGAYPAGAVRGGAGDVPVAP